MDLLIKLAAFVVAIGVLVVVHEFGHYALARLCGVKVLRFSLGFGRPLVRWVSAKSGTEWTICALPLGGYVKMLDERDHERDAASRDIPSQLRGRDAKEGDVRAHDDAPSAQESAPAGDTKKAAALVCEAAARERENGAASDNATSNGNDGNSNGNNSNNSSDRDRDAPASASAISAADLPHAFNRQPVGKRIAIVAAGPLANFALAIVLFAVVYVTGTREPAALVATPPAQSVAAHAGLRGGETIVGIRAQASGSREASEGNATGSPRQSVRSWPDLTWKLMEAAPRHSRVVLVARDAHNGNATRDFSLDLSQLKGKDLNDDFMSDIGLVPGGALQVAAVEAGSAAQRAGLENGDVLERIDAQPVDGADTFIAWVKSHAGKPVRLDIERGTPARKLTLTVVPVAQPDTAQGTGVRRAVPTSATTTLAVAASVTAALPIATTSSATTATTALPAAASSAATASPVATTTSAATASPAAATLSATTASPASSVATSALAPAMPAATTAATAPALTGHIGAALVSQPPMVFVRYGALDSVRLGVRRTWDVTAYSVRMFARMVVGDASLKNLSGPVAIADYAGQSARLGPAAFLMFLGLVSISLGVLNLLPIPVLDGGYLLYYLVEAVSGKTIPGRWQFALQGAGLACIVTLSAIALFNDLARLIHF